MLTILASAKSSPIHGIGLFADQFIPKGTVTWRFDPAWDIIFPKDEVESMLEHQKRLIEFFAYFSSTRQAYIYSIDDSRFLNHSTNPNHDILPIQNEVELCNVSNRDIQIGEELTVDYRSFDDDDDAVSKEAYLQNA
ncbi:MAG: SET domain-containing protein [Minisyncoccia bacterium]